MTTVVVCWRFQPLSSCPAAGVRLYSRQAGQPVWNFPSARCSCRKPATVQRPAGEAVDRGDRRDGTAAQNITPATPATAGVARRLWALGSGHLDLTHSLASQPLVGRCCCQMTLFRTHVCTYRQTVLCLFSAPPPVTCSVVKIAISSHRAAVGMRGLQLLARAKTKIFPCGAVGAVRALGAAFAATHSHTTFSCSRPHRA